MIELINTVAQLRDPKKGCPWDIEQTHRSIKEHLLEEVYEVISVIDDHDPQNLCKELGDLLLQIVLHAQIAEENLEFTLFDVIAQLNKKIRHRHPHVFAKDSLEYRKSMTPETLTKQWEEIKSKENGPKQKISSLKANIHQKFPALLQAQEIGKAASKFQFDWKNTKEVFQHLLKEVEEIKEIIYSSHWNRENLSEEIGDLLFTIAQFSRHLHMDSEVIASAANKKFLSRFEKMEEEAKQQQIDFKKIDKEKLEQLWEIAKKSTKDSKKSTL